MSQILTFPAVNYDLPPEYQKREIRSLLYPLNEYFPFSLADDIANIASYWLYKQELNHGFVGIPSQFNNLYKEFLYSINFELYHERSPYYLAVEIIRSLSRKHNLRQLEQAVKSEDTRFSFKEQDIKFNAPIDLENFQHETLQLLGVKENEIIKFNILKQLRVAEELNAGFKLNLKTREKMRSYSQIKSIPKYQLKLPLFQYRYALKQFNVPEKSARKITLFRDLSASSKINDGAFKGILLYFIDNYHKETLIIKEFTNKIDHIEVIDSLEKLKIYFKKEVIFKYATFHFEKTFLNGIKECFIVSSGNDQFPHYLEHTIVHGMSSYTDSTLETLSKNTKGIFIKL